MTSRSIGAAALSILAVLASAGCGSSVDLDDEPQLKPALEKSTVLVSLGVTPQVADAYDIPDDESFGNGTGWVANAGRGEVVTNAHVAVAGQSVEIKPLGQPVRGARVKAMDLCHDVALLAVGDTSGLKTMPRARTSSARSGDQIFVAGYPGSVAKPEFRVFSGVLDQPDTRGMPGYPHVVEMSANVEPGLSGGPLVTDDGDMLGMDTYTGDDYYESYAITMGYMEQLLPRLRNADSSGWLGWVFDVTYGDEVVVEGEDGDRDFYGWGVVGPAQGTEPVKRLEGDSGKREQYVYAIDGHRFGDDDSSFPASQDEQTVCTRIGAKKAGQKSTLSIVEPIEDPGDGPSYRTFDVTVTYR